MGRRIFLKLANWVSIVVLVVCFMFAINGGGEIKFIGLDLTNVPRVTFIVTGIIAAVISVATDFYGKLAGNKKYDMVCDCKISVKRKVIAMVRPQDSERISKINTYLNCAEVFAYRSTCIKRKYGAVIVKDDVVISTGYNGAPRGMDNCCDIGKCPRIERDLHQGDGYAMCRAIHAEANALLNCSRAQTMGADL